MLLLGVPDDRTDRTDKWQCSPIVECYGITYRITIFMELCELERQQTSDRKHFLKRCRLLEGVGTGVFSFIHHSVWRPISCANEGGLSRSLSATKLAGRANTWAPLRNKSHNFKTLRLHRFPIIPTAHRSSSDICGAPPRLDLLAADKACP